MLRRLLDERDHLIADGAVGTSLIARGLPVGAAPETWLIERPDEVRAVHGAFADAGTDILLTNTFGANRLRLRQLGLESRVEALNRTAAELAQTAARNAGREIVVAGSVGPTGSRVGPDMEASEVFSVFAEQMAALKAAGADVIWIETMYAAVECRAAVSAAIDCGLPYVVTASFGRDGRLADGVGAGALARELMALPVPPVAIGANCGEGPDQIVEIIGEMATAAADAILVAKANNGLPAQIDGRLYYRAHDMAAYATGARAAGARIIGGCCGTTADDVAAMRRALQR